MCNNCTSNQEVCVEELVNLQTGEILDWDRVEGLKDNAMLKVKPELWIEWDFEKNSNLGFDVWKVTKASSSKVWWICPKCNSLYDSIINGRCVRNRGCSYCAGRKVNDTNSLASLNPELASQWHPNRNGNLTPQDITCGSNKKVWWLGDCGHEWEARISKRNNGNNCPYCKSHTYKVVRGINDMWTTNPELAKLLVNPEDGYKYTQSGSQRVNWKCPTCGEIIEDRSINQINRSNISCPNCSDGISYPEKVMFNVLRQLSIEFKYQKTFDWSINIEHDNIKLRGNKVYDFYLERNDTTYLIETHGEQHYARPFSGNRSRSVKEEQENDKLKYELAMSNGIDNYIVIDCRQSEFEYIKNNIMNSRLSIVFDLSTINWDKVEIESTKSLVKVVASLWNDNMKISDISKELNLANITIRRYLKKANNIGLCNYNPKEFNKNMKKIVQLDNNNNILKVYISIREAGEYFNDKRGSAIWQCLNGKSKSSHGYKWMYLEDYESYINNK